MKSNQPQKLRTKTAAASAERLRKDTAPTWKMRATVEPSSALPRRPWVTAKEIAAAAGCHPKTILARMALFRVRPEHSAALPHNWRLGRPYRTPRPVAVAWIDVRQTEEAANT